MLLVLLQFAACSVLVPAATTLQRVPPSATARLTPSPAAAMATPATATKPPTPSPEPTPTLGPALPAYDQELVRKYAEELKGCKPELIPFCARLLNTLDFCNGIIGVRFLEHGKLTRAQVLDYGKTGLAAFDIITFKDGSPAFAFANTDKSIIRYVKQSIAEWEKDVPDFLKSITENGMCVFFQYKLFSSKGINSYYDMNGIFLFNCNKTDIKKLSSKTMLTNLSRHLGIESFGIMAYRLGGSYALRNNNGYIKQDLFKTYCDYLYIRTKKKIYLDFADAAESHRKDFPGNAKEQRKLVTQVMEGDLITPLGGESWSDILAVVNHEQQ